VKMGEISRNRGKWH